MLLRRQRFYQILWLKQQLIFGEARKQQPLTLPVLSHLGLWSLVSGQASLFYYKNNDGSVNQFRFWES